MNGKIYTTVGSTLLKFAFIPSVLLAFIGYIYVQFGLPPRYIGVKLQKDVSYISARRFETRQLEILSQNGDVTELGPWRLVDEPGHYLILVHGYNAQDSTIATYYEGLIEDIQSGTDKGIKTVVFDWDTVGVPFDRLPTAARLQHEMRDVRGNSLTQSAYEVNMYKVDQRRAETTGVVSFLALLSSLPRASTITVLAHSMGCHLLLHAMKHDPTAMGRITSMIWLAPDVDETVVGEPWFRAGVGTLVGGLMVHFSNNDNILTGLSRVVNQSSRLGATGAATLGRIPNLSLIDMTKRLGSDRVHSAYLDRGSASSQMIMSHLRAITAR